MAILQSYITALVLPLLACVVLVPIPTAAVVGKEQVLLQLPMVSSGEILSRAVVAITQLQTAYNSTTGLWDGTGWWNSANCMTIIADYAAVNASFVPTALEVFANTYIQAQQQIPPSYQSALSFSLQARSDFTDGDAAASSYDPGVDIKYNTVHPSVDTLLGKREVTNSGSAASYDPGVDIKYDTVHPSVEISAEIPSDSHVQKRQLGSPNFRNDYYDDEGWWALAWIQAYDVTNQTEKKYLAMAQDLFQNMTGGWSYGTDFTACNGLFWFNNSRVINAISNELFLSVAAHLAHRVPEPDRSKYLNWANTEWEWFKSTKMINSNGVINDGIELLHCSNNGDTVWSYNQGVIVGALIELAKVKQDGTYLAAAESIGRSAIKYFTQPSGAIKDPCDPYCTGDGGQFKGIFIRNLFYLWQITKNASYAATINANAESIWNSDRDSKNRFGSEWDGPLTNASSVATHSSATDALVAAAKIVTFGTVTTS